MQTEEGSGGRRATGGITRRRALRDASAASVAVLLSGAGAGSGGVAVAVKPRRRGWLKPRRKSALRGMVDVFIPGRPEDPVDGALAGGCAEAIDALLSAFQYRRPRIYAGAPFSDRAGSPVNHFKRFRRLDPYEEMAWKLRVRGSRGRKRLEFNGPVRGWQQVYNEGLDALNEAAGGDYGSRPFAEREAILRSGEAAIDELVDVAFPHTWQFMYGAPEYGGNRKLLGWRYTGYDGDVQPRGWTKGEIERPGGSGKRAASASRAIVDDPRLLTIHALASPDAAAGIVARSGDRLSAMRAEIEPIIRWAEAGGLAGGA